MEFLPPEQLDLTLPTAKLKETVTNDDEQMQAPELKSCNLPDTKINQALKFTQPAPLKISQPKPTFLLQRFTGPIFSASPQAATLPGFSDPRSLEHVSIPSGRGNRLTANFDMTAVLAHSSGASSSASALLNRKLKQIALALLEVAYGHRNPGSLVRHTTCQVRKELEVRYLQAAESSNFSRRSNLAVRNLRTFYPHSKAVEVALCFQVDERYKPCAFRLEQTNERWVITKLEIA